MSTPACVFAAAVFIAAVLVTAAVVSGSLGSLDAVSIGGGFR